MLARPLALTVCLLCFVLTVPALAQPQGNLDMKVLGTTISKPGRIDVDGDPSQPYVILIAARQQDWVYKGTTLNVPPDFLAITSSLPGFVGSLDGAGQASAAYVVPNNSAWDDLVLYAQTITLSGNGQVAAVSEVSVAPLNLPGTFLATLGSLNRDRALQTANPLDDACRVLFIGGGSGNLSGASSLRSMEVFDLRDQRFTHVGDLLRARAIHTSTTLDDGRVLVVGGIDTSWNVESTCELVAPGSSFGVSFTGSMSRARTGHAAAKLADGRVLVTGGTDTFASVTQLIQGITSLSEIHDPASGAWSPGPSLGEPRFAHTMTRLADGRWLIAGGLTWVPVAGVPIPVISGTAEILDPSTMTIGATGNLNTPRLAHRTARLPDGRVLLVGGAGGNAANPTAITDCEIFDPSSNSFQVTGSLIGASAYARPVAVSGGRYLVAGGVQGALFTPSAQTIAQLYDPATGTWSPTAGPLQVGRGFHTTTPMPDGSILITGGGDTTLNTTSTAERYTD